MLADTWMEVRLNLYWTCCQPHSRREKRITHGSEQVNKKKEWCKAMPRPEILSSNP